MLSDRYRVVAARSIAVLIMTAILRLDIGNRHPILLGDLLLSSSSRPTTRATLPTLSSVTEVLDKCSTDFPLCPAQKLSIFGESAVIGWAGNYLEAKDAITHLYNVFLNGDLSYDYLDNYLRTQTSENSGFLGFMLRDGGLYQLGYRYESRPTYEYGNVGILGTGASDLAEVVELSRKGESQAYSSDPPPSRASAIMRALQLTGALTSRELASYASITQKQYGGGFEVAYLDRRGFRKVNGITSLFWHAKVDTSGNVAISREPTHALATGYSGDICVVRSCRLESLKDGPKGNWWRTYIPPIYRHVEQEEIKQLKWPEFNNSWMCMFFLVHTIIGTHVHCNVYFCSDATKRQIVFNEQGDRMECTIAGGTMDAIVESLRTVVHPR
jgi:hypothetical protein